MPDCSILPVALQLGARVVDLATGELLASGTGAGVSAGGSPVREEPAGGPRNLGVEGGLSNPHNCTQRAEGAVDIYIGGSLLKCKRPSPKGEQVGGGKRGKVTGFSAASRRRMLYLVGKIQRAALPIMITLTYPSDWPEKSADWKRHLKNWWHRLRRKVKGVGGIWKLEPQKRGAPHFHLLVWGLDGVPWLDLLIWVSRSWYQVVGSDDYKHLQAGTRVERIKNRRGVMSYATKYLGKINEAGAEGWDEPGRFWGVKDGDNIPWADLFHCAVTFRQAVKLLRLMRRAMHCHRGNLPGLTMLSDNPDFWFDRLDRLIT